MSAKQATPPPFRPPIHKRKYLIDFRFQLGFALAVLIMFGLSQAVLYVSLIQTLDQFKDQFSMVKISGSDIFIGIVQEQTQIWKDIFTTVSIWTVFVALAGGILFSHRIAGPMYRLKQHLIQLKNNPNALTEVSFRKGDFFQDVAKTFNDFVRVIKR